MGAGRGARTGAVAILVVATALVGCGGKDKKDSTTGTTAGAQVTTTAAAASTGVISLQAGINDPNDKNIVVTEFLPEAVTVNAGGTVEWKIAGPEPHSVTFTASGQPPTVGDEKLFVPTPPTGPYDGKSLVNSGLIPQGPAPAQPFRVTFPSAGKFTYYCVIHPGMVGTVTVVDKGAKADTQAEVTSRGGTESAKWLDEGRAAKKKLTETPLAKAADGSYQVQMGVTTDHTDILAFSPVSADLKAGDKVTFINNSQAPHTASFAGKTTLPQDPSSPQATTPAPGPSPQTLTADAFYNTGLLPPKAGPPGSIPPDAVRSYTYTVKTAGTYTYACIFHVGSGMAGTLKVT